MTAKRCPDCIPCSRCFAVPFPLGMWGETEAALREARDGADLFPVSSQMTTAAVPMPALLEYCSIQPCAHLPALQEQPRTVSVSRGGWSPPPPRTQGGSMAPSPSCRPRMWARVSAPTDIEGTVQRDKEFGAIGTPSPSGNGARCSGGHEQRGQGEIDLGGELMAL